MSNLNSINSRNDEMLKLKDEKIRKLNQKLKTFEKVHQGQNQQINA